MKNTLNSVAVAAAVIRTAGNTAFAQTQTITLTVDMITHESSRLSWTGCGNGYHRI